MADRPNILLIIGDQLSDKALSARGNGFIATPNIDRIFDRGVRFEQCYTPCGLCQPTRAAFWTGRWPHQTGILSNGRHHHVPELSGEIPTLGEVFSAAGYRTAHYGKKHDAGSLRGFAHIEPEHHDAPDGLEAHPDYMLNYDTFHDRHTTDRVVQWLAGADESPYLLVADLNNPHNICGWVGDHEGPFPVRDDAGDLPPLPENFEDEDFTSLPLPVQYVCCTHNRLAQTAGWEPYHYRRYLDAYRHYTERLDAEVGRILDALEARGDADQTLVVFFADHGDGMVAHRMATKQVRFLEEVMRVPFCVAGAGVADRGASRSAPLTSLLDLLPTLCEAAGIDTPACTWGTSLWPWIREERDDSPHAYVPAEWHTEWGFTIEPGRMLRTGRHKYTRFLEGDGEELYDLHEDGGEMRNLAPDPAYAEELERHRALLREHLSATGDLFFDLAWKADPRWRSHAPGYRHHTGPAAPMAEG
jgi:choline-sulfatase